MYVGGGDPFDYGGLVELVQAAVNYGYQNITVSTKGIVVTPRIAGRLRQAGLSSVQMSIDTLEPNMFDRLVGRAGMFERMLRGWHALRSEGFEINCRATFTDENVTQLPSLFSGLYDMDIFRVKAVRVQEFGRAEHSNAPDPTVTEQVSREVARMMRERPKAQWE
ncbi:molybdenum cofactor biosynthesis protein A, partial [mine drainage metagenome]